MKYDFEFYLFWLISQSPPYFWPQKRNKTETESQYKRIFSLISLLYKYISSSIKSPVRQKALLLSSVIFFLLVYFFTFFPHANALPRGIHQWAQSDRLAVAARYAEGAPLLEPATYCMKTIDGRVGVEFSGGQYLLAQFMKLGVSQEYLPFIYRFFTFSLLFISLLVLANLMLKEEGWMHVILAFITIISTPVLFYYGYNFLPDAWALSLILLSLYFFHKGMNKHIFVILILSGLAALTKTSAGIFFIALYGVFFLQNISKPSVRSIIASLFFIAIAVCIAYYDYTYVHLVNTELWSGVFMSRIVPITSWSEFTEVLDTSLRFKNEYASKVQRWLVIVLAITSFFALRKSSLKSEKTQFFVLSALGLVSFILLFGPQFMHHDYYVLATIMPIAIYGTLLAFRFTLRYVHPVTSLFLLLLTSIVSFSNANSKYFSRMSEEVNINGYTEYYPVKWLKNSHLILADFVPKDELVIVPYAPEHNHSLLYLHRRGFTFNTEEMGRKDGNPFDFYLTTQQPKYIVLRTEYKEQFAQDQPDVLSKSAILFSNADFILYTYGH